MVSHPPDVEILVHVTAPSKTADDVAYCKLAQSYVDFAPSVRKRLREASLPDDDHAVNPEPGSAESVNADEEGPQQSQSQQHANPPLPASLSQEYSTAFQGILDMGPAMPLDSQDLSFRSAVDNMGSPALAHTKTLELDIEHSQSQEHLAVSARDPTSQDIWREPPSEVGDSYPLADTSLLPSSPTQLLERFLGRAPSRRSALDSSVAQAGIKHSDLQHRRDSIEVPSSQPEQVSRGSTSASSNMDVISLSPTDEVIPDTAPSFDAPGYPPLGSEILLDPASPQLASDGPVEDGGTDDFDVTHISNSSIGQHSDVDIEKQPQAPLKRKQADDPQASAESIRHEVTKETEHQSSPGASKRRKISRSDSDSSTITSKLTETLAESVSPSFSPTSATNALEAISSSPSVGIVDVHPDDLIPPKLSKLATDLSSRYKPILHGPIAPLDRGYWLVDCSSLPRAARQRTWAFLARYIRSGLAGWGVWCRRDEEEGAMIKVFCWGCVVKHVYLLVYLASERASCEGRGGGLERRRRASHG